MDPWDVPTGPGHSYNSFTPWQAAHALLTVILPYALVQAYRKIPPEMRGQMFPGPSTSHKALEDMASGVNGWIAIHRHARFRWHT